MEFPAFDHVEWLARAWKHGAPKHNLGSSAFVAPWAGRLDGLELEAKDLAWIDLDPATELRAALAQRWNRADDELIVTSGTTGANLATLLTFLGPGCNVVCERPYYAPLPHLARGLGAEVRFVDRDPGQNWRLDPADVAKATDSNTALVLLTSPNNPTGAAASAEDLEALGAIAANVGARVLVDQVYRELTDHVIAADQHDACITTSGFNKCWGAPGIRTGWLAATAPDTDRIMQVHRLASLSNPVVGSRIGLHLLAREAEARELLDQRLAATHAIYQTWCEDTGRDAGPIGLTAFPAMHEATEIAIQAIQNGVLVIPGEGFGTPGHVRISLGIKPGPLREGLAALDRVVSSLPAQTF